MCNIANNRNKINAQRGDWPTLINERNKVDSHRSFLVLVLLVFLVSFFLIFFVVVTLLLRLSWLLLVLWRGRGFLLALLL